MNLKLLIDGIVRQTTVLLAQLSTASGARAPLAHVADQVFFELAREIEAQGVRKHVVADMFGLAIRSYQKKMQRLTESATQRDRSLWQVVFEFITEHNPTRERVLQRFSHDSERDLFAVLNDLVRSGLVYCTGSGETTVYGATPSLVRNTVQQQHDRDSLSNLLWLLVFRGEATTDAEIESLLGLNAETVAPVLTELLASGRLRREGSTLVSSNLVLPLGTEQGWEAAILDHFRAVAVAIASKVRAGFHPAARNDGIGGSTYTFTVTKSHPHASDVMDLLRTTRIRAQALWDQVAAYNEAHPPLEHEQIGVTFYAGQSTEPNVATTAAEES
jgi:hypothetical protein